MKLRGKEEEPELGGLSISEYLEQETPFMLKMIASRLHQIKSLEKLEKLRNDLIS